MTGLLAAGVGVSVSGFAAAAAPPPLHPLAAVSCARPGNCVAVGQDLTTGAPLAERWNGKAWLLATVRLPAGGKGNGTLGASTGLAGVSCASASSCVAVGSYDLASGKGAPLPLGELWNGSKWSALRPAGNGTLAQVSCISATRCVAVGSSAAFIDSFSGTALIDSWNGTKWTAVKPPAPAKNTGSALSGVSCVSGSRCVATGFYDYLASGNISWRALTEIWNGGKWAPAVPPVPAHTILQRLLGVSCTSAKSCLAVGEYDGSGDQLGIAYAESWNGKAWKTVPVPQVGSGSNNNSVLTGVRCISAASCAAVGQYGSGTPVNTGFSAFWNGKTWRVFKTA